MNEWVRHVAVSAYKFVSLGNFYFDKWLYSITAISQVRIERGREACLRTLINEAVKIIKGKS